MKNVKYIVEYKKLMKDWDYKKNKEFDPSNVSDGSGAKVWWTCNKCGFEWQESIYKRVTKEIKCPKCSKDIKKQRSIEKYIDTMVNKNGSLAKKFPDLLKEWNYEKNRDINPYKITSNTHKKAWWKCKNGHEWYANISNRTRKHCGCPFCSNYKILSGYNDLTTTNPEIIDNWNYEKNILIEPTKIGKNYTRKVWWKCKECGLEWQQTVQRIINSNTDNICPQCYKTGNQTSFPEQAIFYYVSKVYNKAINRYRVMDKYELDIFIPNFNIGIEYDGLYYHERKRTKKTEKEKNEVTKEKKINLYRIKETKQKLNKPYLKNNVIYYNYDRGDNLTEAIKLLFILLKVELKIDIDVVRDYTIINNRYINIATKSSIANKNRELLKEWNYEKNTDLKPENTNLYSDQKVWWICSKGHEWLETPHSRAKGKGRSMCPYCSGRKAIKGENDLATINPVLAKEWNYRKNGNLSPSDVKPGSKTSVWWICSKGHEWKQKISNRKYNGCPYCSNQKILIGYNDLATTNPNLTKEWNCKKNGKIKPINVTKGSVKKVWWKCEKGHEWQATIYNRAYKGSKCPYCAINKAREINQYDLNGKFIRKYKSINQAKQETGICKISQVCLGKRKTAGGFIWKYAD